MAFSCRYSADGLFITVTVWVYTSGLVLILVKSNDASLTLPDMREKQLPLAISSLSFSNLPNLTLDQRLSHNYMGDSLIEIEPKSY